MLEFGNNTPSNHRLSKASRKRKLQSRLSLPLAGESPKLQSGETANNQVRYPWGIDLWGVGELQVQEPDVFRLYQIADASGVVGEDPIGSL